MFLNLKLPELDSLSYFFIGEITIGEAPNFEEQFLVFGVEFVFVFWHG